MARQAVEQVDLVQQRRVLDDQRVGVEHRLAQPDLAVVDAAERHHRRAHALGAEAGKCLRVAAFDETPRPTASRRPTPRPGRRGHGCESGTLHQPAMDEIWRRDRAAPARCHQVGPYRAPAVKFPVDIGQGGRVTAALACEAPSATRAPRAPPTRDAAARHDPSHHRATADEAAAAKKEEPTLDASESMTVAARRTRTSRKSRWPARLDLLQSGTGLLLALFMWGHMFFVSSILLGSDAMWTITKMFEGYFFFGSAHPGIVSVRGRHHYRAAGRARGARRAQVPDQLPPVPRVPRAHAPHAARGHHAVVLAGVHRLRAVLPRRAASVPDADAARAASGPTSRPTACGATSGGRSTSCCCSRSRCTAASACTGWR